MKFVLMTIFLMFCTSSVFGNSGAGNIRMSLRYIAQSGWVYFMEYDDWWLPGSEDETKLTCTAWKCAAAFLPLNINSYEDVPHMIYTDGETLGTVRQRFVAKYGATGHVSPFAHTSQSLIPPGFDWSKNCVGLLLFSGVSSLTSTTSQLAPNTQCGVPIPPDVSCKELQSITLDFGTVSAASLKNATAASSKQTMSCTGVSTALFSIEEPVTLTPTLGAELTINGKPLTTTPTPVTISSGAETSVTIDGTLTGFTREGGKFTGSSILITSYQ